LLPQERQMVQLLLELKLLLVKVVRLLCGCYGGPSRIKCGESGPRPFERQKPSTDSHVSFETYLRRKTGKAGAHLVAWRPQLVGQRGYHKQQGQGGQQGQGQRV
jgi:hypothetical protein